MIGPTRISYIGRQGVHHVSLGSTRGAQPAPRSPSPTPRLPDAERPLPWPTLTYVGI
ncbi:protein of unknown function [Streptantibioticus cattleyicolor NRRL 8057 = DSM 46488]|nr:protein of unknown function [Streptantibioticus cattleyicolor NRRL 8057 = DSM 46488]